MVELAAAVRAEHPHAGGEDTSIISDVAGFREFYPSYVSRNLTNLLSFRDRADFKPDRIPKLGKTIAELI